MKYPISLRRHHPIVWYQGHDKVPTAHLSSVIMISVIPLDIKRTTRWCKMHEVFSDFLIMGLTSQVQDWVPGGRIHQFRRPSYETEWTSIMKSRTCLPRHDALSRSKFTFHYAFIFITRGLVLVFFFSLILHGLPCVVCRAPINAKTPLANIVY